MSNIRRVHRTSAVKIRMDDPGFVADLEATHAAVGRKAIALMDLLIEARGEPYWDGKRIVSIDEILVSQGRYLKGTNPEEARVLLRKFYDAVMTNDHNVVISYVSPLYRADSQIARKTRVSRKTGKINDVEPGKMLCRQLLESGIFPVIEDDLPPGGFYKAAWIAAFGAVRSWHEVNILFSRKTEAMLARLATIEGRWATFAPEIRSAWCDFLAAMEGSGRRLDSSFVRRWRRIRRALLSGYGAREGEPEFFEPFRLLWEDRDYLSVALKAEVLRRQLADRPTTARFPSLRPEMIPLLTCLSRSNTIPISVGSHKGAVVGEIELIRADAFGMKSKHRFRCVPSRYFVGLELATHDKGSTVVATARYFKGNRDRVPVVAEIKEPRIRHRSGAWYLDLIQGVEVSPREGGEADSKEAFKRIGYFINPKSPLKPEEVRTGLRALSIDLGINPALAFAVYSLDRDRCTDDSFEVPGIGWANQEATGKLGEIRNRGYLDRARQFRRRLRSLKAAIRFRSNLLNGMDTGNAHPRYLDSVLAAFTALGLSYESDPDALKELLYRQMSDAKAIYRKLRDEPVRRIGLAVEHFEWAGAIRDYIQMLKTWNHGGLKSRVESTGSIEGECGRYYRYAAAVRKDLVRKLAAEVRRLCVEHRVDVVLVENLEHFRMSVEHEKGTNSLLSLWSPQSILQWIGNAVEPHGVSVIRIDPRHTSRIDPRTGEFGFRDFRAAKEFLVVERDGKLILVDSDIAAAQNLQRRFWARGVEVWQLEGYPIEGGVVPLIGKRAASYFLERCGSNYGWIVDGRFVPLPKARYDRMLAAASDDTRRAASADDDDDQDDEVDSTKFYRHEDRWIPAVEHKKRVASLFGRLADTNQASLSEQEKQYVERVKFAAMRGLRRKSTKGGA